MGMLPPVIQELKTSATEGIAEWGRYSEATERSLTAAAASAEANAVRMEKAAEEAALTSARVAEKAELQVSQVAERAKVASRAAMDQAEAAAAQYDALAARVAAASKEGTASAGQLEAAVKAESAAYEAMQVEAIKANEALDRATLATTQAAEKASLASRVAAGDAARAEAAAVTARESATASAAAVEANSAKGAAALAGLQKAANVALLGTAAAAGAIGYESVKMAGNFEQTVKLLETGAGESAGNLKMVGDGMLKMAGTTGTSAEDLGKAMYYVESAGYHGSDGLKVLSAAAQGAKTDGAEAKEVADALTTAMKDMHAPASEAADVMSKMVAAVGQGKMKMSDFAGSIHNVLPNASALHISFSEVAGALATMTGQGVSADQASQNLNHTIVKLTTPTASMTKAMASYGVSSDDVMKKLGERGLTGTMELLVKAITDHMGPAGVTLRSAFETSKNAAADADRMFANLPPSAKKIADAYKNGSLSLKDFTADTKGLDGPTANLLKQWQASENGAKGFSAALKAGGTDSQTFTGAMKSMLGDQTGLQVALHLTGGASADFGSAVKKIAGTTAEADGSVKDFHQTMETWNNQMAMLKAGAGALGIEIGEKLIPPLLDALHFFQQHTTTLHVLVGSMLGIVGALALIGLGMKVFYIFKTIYDVAKAIREFEVAAKLAALAVRAWQAAQVILDAELWANPVGLIIAAVLAVIAVIAAVVVGVIYAYNHFKWFHDAVNATWEGIKTGAMWLVHAVEAAWSWLKGALSATWSWLKGAWSSTVNAVESAWGHVVSAFHSAVDWFKAIPGEIGSALSTVGSAVSTGFSSALNWLEKLPGVIGSALAAIPGIIYDLIMKAGYWFGFGLGLIVKGMIEGGKAIVHEAEALPGQIATLFENMWHWSVNAVTNLWHDITRITSNMYHATVQWAIDTYNGTTDWFSKLPGRIGSFFTNLWHDITSITSNMYHGTIQWSIDSYNGIADWFSKLPGRVGSFFTNLWHDITSITSNMYHTVVQWAVDSFNGVTDWFSKLPGRVWDALMQLWRNFQSWGSSAISWLYNAGRDIVQGLLNGIGSMFSSAWNAVKDFGSHILKGFQDAMGINSPSLVMSREIGMPIAEGIAHGMTKGAPMVADALSGIIPNRLSVGGSRGFAVVGSSAAAQMASLIPAQRQPVTVENHFYVDGQEIRPAVQRQVLRYSGRNSSNGFALPVGR